MNHSTLFGQSSLAFFEFVCDLRDEFLFLVHPQSSTWSSSVNRQGRLHHLSPHSNSTNQLLVVGVSTRVEALDEVAKFGLRENKALKGKRTSNFASFHASVLDGFHSLTKIFTLGLDLGGRNEFRLLLLGNVFYIAFIVIFQLLY